MVSPKSWVSGPLVNEDVPSPAHTDQELKSPADKMQAHAGFVMIIMMSFP
jgi:hypothetical protein